MKFLFAFQLLFLSACSSDPVIQLSAEQPISLYSLERVIKELNSFESDSARRISGRRKARDAEYRQKLAACKTKECSSKHVVLINKNFNELALAIYAERAKENRRDEKIRAENDRRFAEHKRELDRFAAESTRYKDCMAPVRESQERRVYSMIYSGAEQSIEQIGNELAAESRAAARCRLPRFKQPPPLIEGGGLS